MKTDLSKYKSQVSVLDNTLIRWLEENKTLDSYHQEYNLVSDIFNTSITDKNNLKLALERIQTYYGTHKAKVVDELRASINDVVNIWFENDYNFKFISEPSGRGKSSKMLTTLVDEKRKGKLELVCGGAAQQTIGLLFDFTFVRTSGGEFAFLDEVFSSFGIEEIERIPEVLASVDDIQLLIVEHKCDLIDSGFAVTITITKDLKNGSKISIEDPNNFLGDVYKRINDIEINQEDIEILRLYDKLPENYLQLEKFKNIKGVV